MDKDSELQLGTEVEIIGPTKTGGLRYIGERFIITAKLTTVTNGTTYSASGCGWYPASSLRLVEKLKIGDYVEVIGPAFKGQVGDIGKVFKIEQIVDDGFLWASGQYNYPAESLRKLTPEEVQHYADMERCSTSQIKYNKLKIGDWVEIIGPTKSGAKIHMGDKFVISQVKNPETYSHDGFPWYPASSLRNLDPDPDDIIEKIIDRLTNVEYLLNEMKKIFETKDSSVAFVVDTI